MSIFVLKTDEAITLASGSAIIKAADREIADAAVSTLMDVRREKEKILENAQATAGAAAEQGYKDGYAKGLQVAANEGTAALHDMALKLKAAQLDARQEARDLAFEMLRRILGNFKSEEITAALAVEAAQSLDETSPFTIFVSPENLAATQRELSTLGHICEVEGDETLGELDCRVSNQFGDIHAGLDSQLNVLRSLIDSDGAAE